jgi:hypothetical protein
MSRLPLILLLTAFGWICILYGGWEWAAVGFAGCIIGGIVAAEIVKDRPIPIPTVIIGAGRRDDTEQAASQDEDDPGP